MKKNYFLAIICLLTFTGISFSQADAKTFYWRNDAAVNTDWENATNWWYGAATVPNGYEILLFDGNTHAGSMTNNLTNIDRHQIQFQVGATDSRIINGVTENNFHSYNTTGIGIVNPKIENYTGTLHTINFPIKVMHTLMEINPVNGDLNFSGNIDLINNGIIVYGNNSKTLTISGIISGTGNFTKNDNNSVIFNGANTYTGFTLINNGSLDINDDMATDGIELNNSANLVVNSDLSMRYLTLNSTSTVTIKAGKSITLSENLTNNSNNIILEHGASLIVNGVATGNITYNVNVADDKWHLISSPVVDETYGGATTWIGDNAIKSGTTDTNNRGISTYDNGTPDGTTDHWRYYNTVGGTETTFGSGTGYSLKRTSAGNYSFTGTYPNGTITPAISTNTNNWNMIGNPYPSYIDIAAFITENTTTNDNLADAFPSVYVWNAGTTSYDDLTTGYIHPGQAFFINSKVDGNASITEAMQSHQTMIPFYKSSTTSIKLILSNGTSTKNTKINYLDGKTTSLDAGFDIGMFDGVASDLRVYTHLIENNEGIAFARQALPSSDIEALVVPVGVKAAANTEITISAEALNLPTGIKVFLEDKVANTFTRLDEANSKFKVTLTDAVNGVGRFYLYTTQSALSVKDVVLNGVNIFKSDASTIRISGLPQGKATVSLFNILGKQVMTTSFEAKTVKDISLPKLATGIYFAKVQTETGKVSKKIILE